jgi:hypothetical protein
MMNNISYGWKPYDNNITKQNKMKQIMSILNILVHVTKKIADFD